MKEKFKTYLMVAIVAMVAFGGIGLAVAQTSNTVYVDPATPTDDTVSGYDADTYTTIQYAVDNSTENGTISIVPGTYQENITLSANNLTFQSNSSSDYVTIDGEINGTHNSNVTSVNIGDRVTVTDGVLVQESTSGGISIGSGTDLLNDKLYGVPLALWGLLVLVVAYVGYIEYYQKD